MHSKRFSAMIKKKNIKSEARFKNELLVTGGVISTLLAAAYLTTIIMEAPIITVPIIVSLSAQMFLKLYSNTSIVFIEPLFH